MRSFDDTQARILLAGEHAERDAANDGAKPAQQPAGAGTAAAKPRSCRATMPTSFADDRRQARRDRGAFRPMYSRQVYRAVFRYGDMPILRFMPPSVHGTIGAGLSAGAAHIGSMIGWRGRGLPPIR